MELLRDFENIGKNDVALAGGKGASLGEMTRAGISVPPGFVILSSAFEEFLEETDLNVEIDAILDSVNHKEMHTVENASEKIQALILQAKMSQDISSGIQKFFKNLNSKYVAVRSSATAEDSASAAWAGQLESYLNTTEENLLKNVKKCWASLFTPRAIFYRFEKDLHKQKISVAVVVQKMVESEKSGIAFSVHPVTQDRNQLIIEAGLGLGEAIVSGSITPDSYVVEKQPRRVIDKNIQTQSRGLYRVKNGGNEWRDIPKEQGEEQILSDKEILELSETILKIESHYGFPSDIEWAFKGGKFYIVQSRPITTLSREVELGDNGLLLAKSFINEAGEIFPGVATKGILVQSIGWNTEHFFGKYYKDQTPLPGLIVMKGKEAFAYMSASKLKAISSEVFLNYWENPDTLNRVKKDLYLLIDRVNKAYDKLTYEYINNTPWGKLKKETEQLLNDAWSVSARGMYSVMFDKDFLATLLNKIEVVIENFDDIWIRATVPLFSSLEKKRQLYLLSLVRKKLPWPSILERCQYFGSGYSGVPDLPTIDQLLKEEYANVLKLKKENVNASVQNLASQIWFNKLSANDKKLTRYIQDLIETRDIRKDPIVKSLVIIQRFGERVAREAGFPIKDLWYCRMNELLAGSANLQAKNSEIKERENGFSILVHYDGRIDSEYEYDRVKKIVDQTYLRQHGAEITGREKQLIGQTGSPGVARGRVVVINNFSAEKDKMKIGDVLVAGMTRPEFVPLMKRAVAVVTDEGGITCHAAIVSRELNIPCVIGTKTATRSLKDGDMVEVNADDGIVKILRE